MSFFNTATLALEFAATLVEGVSDEGFTTGMAAIGAGLAMIPGVGVGIGQGKIGAEAVAATCRQPEAKSDILQTMIIGMGITETAAIYGVVIAFVLIFFS